MNGTTKDKDLNAPITLLEELEKEGKLTEEQKAKLNTIRSGQKSRFDITSIIKVFWFLCRLFEFFCG